MSYRGGGGSGGPRPPPPSGRPYGGGRGPHSGGGGRGPPGRPGPPPNHGRGGGGGGGYRHHGGGGYGGRGPPHGGNHPHSSSSSSSSYRNSGGGSGGNYSPPAASANPDATTSSSSFDENQLPSVRDGSMTYDEERDKRKRTCRFIEEAGRLLKLPRVTVATAMVFFHRFYAKHSFKDHERFEVAMACLLLAAKTEESPKKLSHVIQECHRLKSRAAQKSSAAAGLGASPLHDAGRSPPTASSSSSSSSTLKDGLLDVKSEEYLQLKERILLLERVILHTIGFELSVEHPYKCLVEQIKKMNQSKHIEYSSSSSNPAKMTNELVQYAMNFANDSMHTSLCIQFAPTSIASACVYMSAQCCKVQPAQSRSWFDILVDIDVESLASIVMQIMELIAEKKGADLPVFRAIRENLEKLKQEKSSSSARGTASLKPDGTTSSSSIGGDSKRQRLADRGDERNAGS